MKHEKLNLFNQLLLWQKLVILGTVTIVLMALPFGTFLYTAKKNIDVAENELNGIKPFETIQKVTFLTQQHRDLSASLLSKETTNTALRAAKEKEVSDGFQLLDNIVKESINDSTIIANIQSAHQHWQVLLDKVKKGRLNVGQSNKAHSELIGEYFLVMDQMADYFELSLDPQRDSYFLMRSSLYLIPQLIESLHRARALGTEMLSLKDIEYSQFWIFPGVISLANNQQLELAMQLKKTIGINPRAKEKLESIMENSFKQVNSAIKISEDEIIKNQSLHFDNKAYYNTLTIAINSLIELNTQSLDQLQQSVHERKKAQIREVLTLSSGILGLLAIGMLIIYLISRSITVPVAHLIDVMQRLGSGDHSVRANLMSADEIGILGRQFNGMVDQREFANAKVQFENDTLNNSVIDLLQAVAKLAQRDLTVKVPVAEDITGPVADALNLLSSETAKVLNRVFQVATDVSAVSKQIKSQSDTVIHVAEEEKREVEQSSKELTLASEAMLAIANIAELCNQAASKTIQSTDKAQKSVLDSIQGITLIRSTIHETEKRIKRLGERSQEIGSVITIINGISERTHILALNASMHAASAGEAGRGFAVVATEVQKLAENARAATLQISGLVKNIQIETADTITTMNDAITQVVEGTALAQQAGNEMLATRETTGELVNLVQRIADSSKEQAETVQRLKESVIQIQKNTEETYRELQDQGLNTDRLVLFSGSLVESVSVFTLPKLNEVAMP